MTKRSNVRLVRAAIAARSRAHAPYSNYEVGAAVFALGKTFAAANVENASYGLTMCAERAAIFAAVSAGARSIEAVAVVTSNGGAPCGACRQVMREFAKPSDGAALRVLLADVDGRVRVETTLAELLPRSFGPEDVAPTRGRGRRTKG